MNYGQVFYADSANGIGCRVSLFVSGCRHHCKGCFNEETWDFGSGVLFDRATEDDIIREMKLPYIDGLSILGGEPMEPENQAALRPFLERAKAEAPNATIWIYSGSTFEDLTGDSAYHTDDTAAILRMTDILVDGPFIESRKDITLRFRGSSNQRVIDVQRTLREGQVMLSPYGEK